jgi:hypothetical protein
MNNNSWFKLAAVSLTGIVISFAILWGIQQFNQSRYYKGYNNGYNMQQSGMYNQGNMNAQGGMNMQQGQGNMNMQQGQGTMNGQQMQGNMNMQQGQGSMNGQQMQGGSMMDMMKMMGM